MSRELERLRATWSALGEDDPLWAILSRPDKRGGGWNEAEFFAAGEQDVSAIDTCSGEFGLPLARRRALDFGCGVGRLTRALASRYEQVIGVDISASMLSLARELNATFDNVRFVENAKIDLAFVEAGSIDLLCSLITLQHMPVWMQRQYLVEFMRVLAAGGLAVFQLACAYSRDWRGAAYRLLPNRLLAPARRMIHSQRETFEMHVLAQSEVVAIIAAEGLRILRVESDAGAGAGFESRRFFVTRDVKI